MRILWATSHRPDRNVGGGWSYLHFLLELSARWHRVTLLCGGLATGERLPELEQAGIEVRAIDWNRNPGPRHKADFLRRLVRGPGPVAFDQVAPCADALAHAIAVSRRANAYDLGVVFPGEMATVLEAIDGPAALVLGDAYTNVLRTELRAARSLRHRLRYGVELAHARRWEQRLYPTADIIGCPSQADATTLRQLTGRPVTELPLPIGDEWFVEPDRPRLTNVVSFIAGLDYRPNVDAVCWLASEVWPRVREAIPDVEGRVVGRNPVPEVSRALAGSGLALISDVPDIRPCYWETAVMLCPIRLGAGVKTKLLHAMATRTPVVATSAAVDGIDLSSHPLLVADDAAGLAEAVVETLRDPDAAAQRASRARALAEQYRADRVGHAVKSFLQRAVTEHEARASPRPR